MTQFKHFFLLISFALLYSGKYNSDSLFLKEDKINTNLVDKPFANNFGIFSSAINLQTCNATASPYAFYNFSSTGVGNQIGSESFDSNNLGSFFQNTGALILKGGEAKTFKKVGGNDGNVCSVILNYRFYLQSAVPAGVFSQIDIPFFENCSGTAFVAGDPCIAANGDQKWQSLAGNVDLTVLTPEVYVLEAYFEIIGDNNTGACDLTEYDNNGGNNYKATFTILSNNLVTNSPVCQNDDLTLEAPSAASYSWSGPNGFSSTVQNPVVTNVAAANQGSYSVEITTSNNCVETLSTTVNITVLPIIDPPEINTD